MRALSLCQTCKRHIRVSEQLCPFCGAAHSPVPEARALRPRGLPGSRAALFLAGAAGAPACVEEPEPDVPQQGVPVYGVPIDSGAASDASRDARGEMALPVYGVPVYGLPIDRDAGTDANLCGAPSEPMPVPVYGVPVDGRPAPDASACGGDAGAKDAGPGPKDAGPIVVPPYGLPIDSLRDAAARDGEVLVMPVYGLALEVDPEE